MQKNKTLMIFLSLFNGFRVLNPTELKSTKEPNKPNNFIAEKSTIFQVIAEICLLSPVTFFT
jgi:hypothetical protein